ncbi:MAG: peptidylprolyl isomerase [Clostridia bacterium]|nr:peptidylprolyl isomerase [Clostridia bacterium]
MDKTKVLAVVGSRQITTDDVNMILQNLAPQTAAQFKSEEGMKNLIRELVNQELFYLDAVENAFDKEEEFLQEIEKAKLNILKQYALNKVLNSAVVGENEVVAYYLANQSQFSAPASVSASHILVDELEKAQDIAKEIENGLSFSDAAKEYSKCPSGKQGGSLGYFSAGRMVPEFEKAAFGMEKGEISSPVKTQFGYHLIMVEDKKDEAVKSVDQVRDQIVSQIMAQKQNELYQSKVNELKGKYPIEINL